MGKVMPDTGAADSSDDERKTSDRKEQKVRTKKKKRKRDLEDLHQKVLKARRILDKKTKGGGKSGKARGTKICSRLLPRPLAGIYRNGATSKDVRRTEKKLTLNDLDNARIQGDVFKLLNGYESNSVREVAVKKSDKEVSKDSIFHSPILASCNDKFSPILGKTDGNKRCSKNDCVESLVSLKNEINCQRNQSKNAPSNSERSKWSPVRRYEELCAKICSENFEGQDFLDDTSEPLLDEKKKLRSIYADSFRSQLIRTTVKHGTILEDQETPSPFDVEHRPSTHKSAEFSVLDDPTQVLYEDYPQCIERSTRERSRSRTSEDLKSDSKGKSTSNASSTRLIFIPSASNASNVSTDSKKFQCRIEKRNDTLVQEDSPQTSAYDYASLEVNDPGTCYKNDDLNRQDFVLKYLKNDTRNRSSEKLISFDSPCLSALSAPVDREIPNEYVSRNQPAPKGRRTEVAVLNNATSRNFGKFNEKAAQQSKIRSSKYIPAILRRCSNAGCADKSDRPNFLKKPQHERETRRALFDAPSKDVLFVQSSLASRLDDDSKKFETPSVINAMFDESEIRNRHKDGHKEELQILLSNSTGKDAYVQEETYLRADRTSTKSGTPDLSGTNGLVARRGGTTQSGRLLHPLLQKALIARETREVGHCLRLDDETIDVDARRFAEKMYPEKQKFLSENCVVHRHDCHVSTNYHPVRVPRNCSSVFHGQAPKSHYQQLSSTYPLDDVSIRDSKETDKPIRTKSCHVVQNVEVRQKPRVISNKLLYKKGTTCQSGEKHVSDQGVCYVVLDRCKRDVPKNTAPPVVQETRSSQNVRFFCQESATDVGILNGVQNLQILSVDETDGSRGNFVKFEEGQCASSGLLFEEHQPVKYLAFEDGTKTQRIPIYPRNARLAPVEVSESTSSRRNRSESIPRESVKIMVVPGYERKDVVYVKPQNLMNRTNVEFEECPRAGPAVFYQPEFQSNVQLVKNPKICEIRVAKKNVVEVRGKEHEASVYETRSEESSRKSRRTAADWEEVQYRPSFEYVDDACARSQGVFYGK